MFRIGQEYRRTEIHDLYGGNRQNGISVSKKENCIFIFTSHTGLKHGYKDEYQPDGLFWYSGEGQKGDMLMERGNLAIRDHVQHKRTLYVFEYIRKAYVRYVGIAYYVGHHEETRPDTEGNMRKAFVFHLDIDSTGNLPESQTHNIEVKQSDIKDLKKQSVETWRAIAAMPLSSQIPQEKRQVFAYYRSQALKMYVLARAQGYCEGCAKKAPFLNQTKKPYLECHHVYRLADGGPDHPKNVIALCPNCHRQAHYSYDATIFNEQLQDKVNQLEQINETTLQPVNVI